MLLTASTRRHSCPRGAAHAIGIAQSPRIQSTTSACVDVSTSILDIINSCTRTTDWRVGGVEAAYGNGNLIVGGTGVGWNWPQSTFVARP